MPPLPPAPAAEPPPAPALPPLPVLPPTPEPAEPPLPPPSVPGPGLLQSHAENEISEPMTRARSNPVRIHAVYRVAAINRRVNFYPGEPTPQLHVDGLHTRPVPHPPHPGLQTQEHVLGSASYVEPQLSCAVSQTQPHTPAPFWKR